MKRILISILAVFSVVSIAVGQVLSPAMEMQITTVNTMVDPYSVTGTTSDVTSNWDATNIAIGDTVYQMNGANLRVYEVTAIGSAVGVNFTITIDDLFDTGDIPQADEVGLFHPLSGYVPYFGNLSEQLQTAVRQRFLVGDGNSPVRDTITQAAHGFSVLTPVREFAGAFVGADADAYPAEAVIVEVIDVNRFIIGRSGSFNVPAHGLLIDTTYYVSTTAGQIVTYGNRPPQYEQQILTPKSTNRIVVHNYPLFQTQAETLNATDLDNDTKIVSTDAAVGQDSIITTVNGNVAYVVTDDGLGNIKHTFNGVVDPPVFQWTPSDTTTANANPWVTQGAVIYQSSDSTLYVKRVGSWVAIGSGAGLPIDTVGLSAISVNEVYLNATGDTLKIREKTAATSIDVDASAAPFVYQFPASNTADGIGVLFFTNTDLTNSATATPQTGETINGTVDRTFYFSAYPVETIFQATEIVGGWAIAIAGASTGTNLTYAKFGSETAKTTTGNVQDFLTADIIDYDPQGAIAADGTFTAQNSGLHRFDFVVDCSNNNTSDNNSHFTSFFYTLNGGAPIQFAHVQHSSEMNNNIERHHYVAFDFIDLTAGDNVRIFIGDDAGAAASNVQDLFRYDVSVMQLPSQETVLAGHVEPTPTDFVTYNLSSTTIATQGTAINTWQVAEQSSGASAKVAYSAGVFTVQPGRWNVSGIVGTNNSVSGGGEHMVRKNGVMVQKLIHTTGEQTPAFDLTFDLIAPTTFDIFHNVGGNLSSYTVDGVNITFREEPTATVVNPGTVPVVDVAENKWTSTANNVAGFSGSTSVLSFESFSDNINSGSVATFDGTNLVITAGANDVSVESIISTAGTGSHSGTLHFRDAADAIGTLYGDGVDVNGVSEKGVYGQASDVRAARAIVKAGTTVTLNIVYSGSANNQKIQQGSFIHVKEIVGQKTVINTADIPTDNTGAVNQGILTYNSANSQYEAGYKKFQGARRFAGGTTTIPNSGAATLVTLNSTDYNTTSTLTNSSSGYTVAVSGYYRITGNVGFTMGSFNSSYMAHIMIDGSSAAQSGSTSGVDNQPIGSVVTKTMFLTAGQVIRLGAAQDTGGNQTTIVGTNRTYLEVEFVGI